MDHYMSPDATRFLASYPKDIEHPLGPDWYILCAEKGDQERVYSSLDEDLFGAIKMLFFTVLEDEDEELADTIISNNGGVCWDHDDTEYTVEALRQAVELAKQHIGQDAQAPVMARYCQESLEQIVAFCDSIIDADPQWLVYFRG